MTEINKDGFWKWSKFGSGNHDGWLYQENSESEQITYIYDDFSTVIHGKFLQKTLVEGRASKISAFRCNNGLLEIKLSKRMSEDIYKYQPITVMMPLKPTSTIMDPLEKNQIYIGPSHLNGMSFGEGVFAKRTIPGKLEIKGRGT